MIAAMTDRRGFVLPVVVVCGLLAISLVLTFQFVSSSDYKQVARLMRTAQAAALADLASDELAAKLNTVQWGPGGNKPPWVDPLLADLDAAKSTSPINVKKNVAFSAADYPVTLAQAQKSGLVKVDKVAATVGPFAALNGGGFDAGLIYKEPLYPDDAADPLAHDLRGPMSVEIQVSGTGGPFDLSKTFRRGQELAITDTTPPGRAFALMAYLPPHHPDYAVQDLNKGGTWEVTPNAGGDKGRVMMRGPLVLVPEESPALPATPDKIWLGGNDPTVSAGQSQSYPDAKFLQGLATVPGPRELQHPANQAAGFAGEIIGGVDSALFGVQKEMDPRRPGADGSSSRLKTKPKNIHIVLVTGLNSPCPETWPHDHKLPVINVQLDGVSPVLAKNFDTASPVFDTIDRDVAAYYPPMAYFYAPLSQGQQKFLFKPTATSIADPSTYRGVKIGAGGTGAAPWTGSGLAEGDAVVTEPVPRAGADSDNVGLIGVWGVALHESKTYLAVDVLTVAKWLVQKGIDTMPDGNDKIANIILQGLAWVGGCGSVMTKREVAQLNKDNIAVQALSDLGIDQSVKFLVRRFGVYAKLALGSPGNLSATSLESKLRNRDGVVAPFGAYYHDNNFWTTKAAGTPAETAMTHGLKDPLLKPTTQTQTEGYLKQLLPDDGTAPQVGAVDSDWPAGGEPNGQTDAKSVRDWLVDTYLKDFLKATPAKAAADPGAALTALLEVCTKVRGIAEPRIDTKKRPNGAFGPTDLPAAPPLADKAELMQLYPRGTFPAKARDWEGMVTRTYDSVDDYLTAETVNGKLELRGAVLCKSGKSAKNIEYKGRGILIVCTTDAQNAAALTGTVKAADAQSWLTVVHRVKPSLVSGVAFPPLTLGASFVGTVYSETGVKASGPLQLKGSLITGLLNKGATADGDKVQVMYQADKADLKDAWTVEATGEVSSVDPGP